MSGWAGYLRLLAVVLALGLSTVLVMGPRLGVSEELPYWLLGLPIVLLMASSWLASRARGANIERDGSTETKPGDDR